MAEEGIRSAQRMFTLLEQLAQDGPLGVTALSRLTGLGKATVYRHLDTLCRLGYARQNPDGQYDATMRLVQQACCLLDRTDPALAVFPLLERLAAATDETVHFARRDGFTVRYAAIAQPPSPVTEVARLGRELPASACAEGKAMLASLADEEIRVLWKGQSAQPLTPHTLTDWPALLSDLLQTRKDGYAVEREESRVGVYALALPVHDYTGTAQYAVGLTLPAVRMTPEREPLLVARLRETAAAAERELGWRGIHNTDNPGDSHE